MSTKSLPSPLRLCCIQWNSTSALGLHLSRAPWDPYPWISEVRQNSTAYKAGIRSGDCILEVNGEDIIGKKIIEVANKIKENSIKGETGVNLLLWNAGTEHNVSPHLLQKFSGILQNLGQLLECPVCFEIVQSPSWQCVNGHILCSTCRTRSSRCPVCRVSLQRRGRCLVADKLFDQLMIKPSMEDGINYNKMKQTDKKLIPIATRQPQRQTNYYSIFIDILNKKRSRKKGLIDDDNSSDTKWSKLDCKDNINCPTGNNCKIMSNQNELFSHLFKVHQLSVTQYYCVPGDFINIKFSDKSIVCLTFSQNTENCQFFVVKFSNLYPNEELCWVWYMGKMFDDFKYCVKLQSQDKTIDWLLKPISISYGIDEIINMKEFVMLEKCVNSLKIQIIKTN